MKYTIIIVGKNFQYWSQTCFNLDDLKQAYTAARGLIDGRIYSYQINITKEVVKSTLSDVQGNFAQVLAKLKELK